MKKLNNPKHFNFTFLFFPLAFLLIIFNTLVASQLPTTGQLSFKTSFERAVYSKFYSKYKNSADLLYNKNDNIISYGKDYKLSISINQEKQVVRIYRILNLEGWKTLSDETDNTSLWLGQFLYRIDAGDFAAAYDLVFFENMKLGYKNLKSKSRIISQLIEEHNTFIIPIRIERDILEKNQLITIFFSGKEFLKITLPKILFIDQEIDVLQDDLFKKIVTFINNKKLPQKTNLEDILNLYSGAIEEKDHLLIPFPEIENIRVPDLHFDMGDGQIRGLKINLERKNDNTIIFNKSYLIDYYLQTGSQNIKNLQTILRNIYLALLPVEINLFKNSPSGKVIYHGYNREELSIKSDNDWLQLKASLYDEGPLYFFPSRIDETVNKVAVKGLMYIFKKQSLQYYHFSDVLITFEKKNIKRAPLFIMHLYPYAKRHYKSN